jgi:hypothetical protein
MAMKPLRLTCVLAAVAALAACSDNPSADPPAPPPPAGNEIPASALASPAAITSWAASLQKSESGEPVDVNKAGRLPTSETEAPLPL